jgi:hypothetical protein
MAGSINEFKSSFKNDLARPNRFDVDIPIPLTLIPYLKTSNNLRYRCENANLPGRTLATLEQKTYGPVEKFPYMTTYNDLDLTFIVDGDMSQKVFFDAWLNYVNPLYNNNFRYKSDYATDLRITQYDVTNQATYSVDLYEAYPISINQLDLDWSNDSYHKLTVTFAYTKWKNNSLEALAMEFLDSVIGGVADKFGGLGGTAGGALSGGLNGVLSGGLTSITGGATSSGGSGIGSSSATPSGFKF